MSINDPNAVLPDGRRQTLLGEQLLRMGIGGSRCFVAGNLKAAVLTINSRRDQEHVKRQAARVSVRLRLALNR